MSVPVYITLLHYPITNRHGAVVTTAVTNMDLHDISRSARTFGVKKYFIVTPIEDQHELLGRILSHWRSEQSREWHPDRVEAVSLIQVAKDFNEVKAAISAECGTEPEVAMPDARPIPNQISYAQYREELAGRPKEGKGNKPINIVFGTGWGVSETFYPEVHRFLAPVYGPEGKEGYNHLSVRSAVAIILDRLFGK